MTILHMIMLMKFHRAATVFLLIGAVCGCASTPEATQHQPQHATVKVFFATDRDLTGSKEARAMFGTGRSTLSYGTCDISIPRDHRMGQLESKSIWRLEFRDDPEKHVVLLSASVLPESQFFAALASRAKETTPSEAFVFVHGYNVTFEDAARRTGQMAYDLGFGGAPILYSWPSQGATAAYTVDEQNIEWTEAHLKQFLIAFFQQSDAQKVYLIAHSMGNRAVTRVVGQLLSEQPFIRARLKEVILAAPDIDAQVFKEQIAPVLLRGGRPITLYASSSDDALLASKLVHGYARAGDAGGGLVVLSGMETVDASGVDSSFVGHSYYGDSRSVLSDMYYILNEGLRANKRAGLRETQASEGVYWEFRK